MHSIEFANQRNMSFVGCRRCYNCGDFANHIAARCPQSRQAKRCHHCKSPDHLIAECPDRATKPSPADNSDTLTSLPLDVESPSRTRNDV